MRHRRHCSERRRTLMVLSDDSSTKSWTMPAVLSCVRERPPSINTALDATCLRCACSEDEIVAPRRTKSAKCVGVLRNTRLFGSAHMPRRCCVSWSRVSGCSFSTLESTSKSCAAVCGCATRRSSMAAERGSSGPAGRKSVSAMCSVR
eukprot:Amastigsp_a842835_72.p2 type:complete len:148 gc:universal Amastigsp_a842835_72:587-1030(+)